MTEATEATPLLDPEAVPVVDGEKVFGDEADGEEVLNAEEVVEQMEKEMEMTRHEVAAFILDNTVRGSPLTNFSTLPRTLANRKNYLFFENTHPLRAVVVTVLVMLSFFELPSYCSPTRECVSADGTSLFLSGVPYVDVFWGQLLNAALLAVLVFFSLFDYYMIPGADLHSRAMQLRFILFFLIIDAFYVFSFGGYPPFRPAPYFRALLPLFYWTSLWECTAAVMATVRPFADAFAICTMFTLLFGWIVTLMFHDAPYADRYWGNLTTGLYSAFTSLTTADWPMQIMAILDVSRASSLMFIAFIVIGVFLLFNVLLAVVYNGYTGHMEELVIAKLEKRHHSLGLAYDVLVSDDGTCGINDIQAMFNELRKNKKHSSLDEEHVDLLFTALDDDEDSNISRAEFLDIIRVLQLKFIVELENKSLMENWFPAFYDTPLWQAINRYVRSSLMNTHLSFVMIINVAVVLYESTLDLRMKESSGSVELYAFLELGFSVIYILEMTLKVFSLGLDRFWKDFGNRFDFTVTMLLLLGAGYVLLPFTDNDPELMRYLLILRCLRLIALFSDVQRFRRIVHVFKLLIPASAPLFTFFFLSLYVFSAIGVELFGGLIYAGNPALDDTKHKLVDAYVGNDYFTLNFNDMAAGWHVLFSAVIVGYITEIAEAIASASAYGNWTKWYFIASFVVNTLIVSNCVIAFVVDLFVMEDEEDDNWLVDNKELQARYGAKRVKILQERTSADQVYASMFRERVKTVFESVQ